MRNVPQSDFTSLLFNLEQFTLGLLYLLLFLHKRSGQFLEPDFFLLKLLDSGRKLLNITVQFLTRFSNLTNVHLSSILFKVFKDVREVRFS